MAKVGRPLSSKNKKRLKRVESGEKSDFVSSFLIRFEEAHATIKEADFMLNALMEANENSKQLTGQWKHTGEELMLERTSFIEKVFISNLL